MGVATVILAVRLLGVEVLRVELLDEPEPDHPRVDDLSTPHVVGFAAPLVEVREPLPDREP